VSNFATREYGVAFRKDSILLFPTTLKRLEGSKLELPVEKGVLDSHPILNGLMD
jgi:hypothetical protein